MSHLQRTVRADVQATQAYVVAKAEGMLKLDAMENPNQLPEALRADLAKRLERASLNRYPVPTLEGVEAALRASTPIPGKAAVLFGNGSDELIDVIIRACCNPGDVVMSPVPTFVMYAVSAQWAHARFEGVTLEPDFSLNLTGFLAAMAHHQPKVVFLAYPNNPTGVALSESEVEAIVQQAPGLVVVDEAYEAFAQKSFMARVLDFPNVLVLRTLSKQGLAGIRLGYAVASVEWIEQLDKVRPPYNVNILTRIAGEFALQHAEVLKAQTNQLKANRTLLTDQLMVLKSHSTGLIVYKSEANFILIRVQNALEVYEDLKKQGILIKYLGKAHPLLHNCLRITVSTEHENQLLLNGLQKALQAAKAWIE